MLQRIVIDAMGGDIGPRSTVPAALRSLALHTDLEVVLVGRETDIQQHLGSLPAQSRRRLSVCHCDQVVDMGDKPAHALRNKKDSSMRLSIDLLKAGEVSACVSAGNTGALMAMGCYVLKTSPGIDRPAISVALPTREGHSYLLDLGANVDSRSEHLYQFALMGSHLSRALDGVPSPRVALLNIGEEEIKGNEQVKLAAQLIGGDSQLNYVGFIEADHLFDGLCDVIVCDGFVGNVALKAAEGTAKLITFKGRRLLAQSYFARLLFLLAKPGLKRVLHEVDPEVYNGAFFLGLQGVVVKSHGSATADAFHRAIEKAIVAVENRMVQHLDHSLAMAYT